VINTLSVGVVQYEEGEELSRLVSRADQAMYTAKKQGGNRSLFAEK
jgi:PleD family two-component response regulator